MNRVDLVEDSPPLGGNISKAHLVLSWEYNLKSQSGSIPNYNYNRNKYLYNKADHTMISEYINGIDWVGDFKDKNVQDSYSSYLGHYNKACELYIHKIDISGEIKPRVKWLTRGMKNNMLNG